MPSWFTEGTVTVASGNTVVTGSGTKFSNSRSGDMFVGPDMGIYQVVNPSSDTSISISPAYRGANAAGALYGIVPVNGYPKALADAVNQLVLQWGSTLAGLGAVSTKNVVPVNMGGTGATTPADARTNLGLGTAAVAAIGYSEGNVADAFATGRTRTSVAQSWLTNVAHGLDPNLYPPGSANMPTGGTGYWYKQIVRHSDTSNRLTIAWPYGLSGASGTIKFQSIYDGATTPWIELYHTGNTTRAADGTLKAI